MSALKEAAVTDIASKLGVTPAQVPQSTLTTCGHSGLILQSEHTMWRREFVHHINPSLQLYLTLVAGGAALGHAEGLLCHSKVGKPGEDGGQLGCWRVQPERGRDGGSELAGERFQVQRPRTLLSSRFCYTVPNMGLNQSEKMELICQSMQLLTCSKSFSSKYKWWYILPMLSIPCKTCNFFSPFMFSCYFLSLHSPDEPGALNTTKKCHIGLDTLGIGDTLHCQSRMKLKVVKWC